MAERLKPFQSVVRLCGLSRKAKGQERGRRERERERDRQTDRQTDRGGGSVTEAAATHAKVIDDET